MLRMRGETQTREATRNEAWELATPSEPSCAFRRESARSGVPKHARGQKANTGSLGGSAKCTLVARPIGSWEGLRVSKVKLVSQYTCDARTPDPRYEKDGSNDRRCVARGKCRDVYGTSYR